jgi:hypothetical protein
MNVEPTYPRTTNGGSTNFVQRHNIADRGLTQLFEHFVVILWGKAHRSHERPRDGLGSTYSDVIFDCVVSKIWSVTVARIEIGFLFDRPLGSRPSRG